MVALVVNLLFTHDTWWVFVKYHEKKKKKIPLMFYRRPWRLEPAILEISAPPEAEV